MPTSKPPLPAIDSQVADLAGFCLAIRRFGITATNSILAAVGNTYIDNASVAVLGELRGGAAVRLRDLSQHLELPSPTLSRVIDKMEDNGDVRRRPGPLDGDGRAVTVEITGPGAERARRTEAALLADAAASRHDLDEAKRCLDDLRPPSASTDLDEDVGDVGLCGAMARSGIRLVHVLKEISESGDVTEALALMALADGTDSRPTQIGVQVGLSSGGTTKVLDRLERSGSIERSFGMPGDRRGVSVRLTSRGAAQLERMAADISPHVAELRPVIVSILDHFDD